MFKLYAKANLASSFGGDYPPKSDDKMPRGVFVVKV